MTRLTLLSRAALFLARRLPRGYWRVARFAARRDPALHDLPIPLAVIPGGIIRADLREGAFMNFLRHGCIPGQTGHDLLFRRLIRAGDTVFDVGANVGYTMLLFAHLAGSRGKVVAFEPGRRAFALLARNAERQANATVLQIAVSDRTGEAAFHEMDLSDLSTLEPIEGGLAFTVPTVTLDEVATREGDPEFVKIDVEGHEPAVLRGMAGLFRAPRPPIVLFEALDRPAREVCVATIASLVPDPEILRLRRDGSVAAELDQPGTNDYLFLPAWAASRLD